MERPGVRSGRSPATSSTRIASALSWHAACTPSYTVASSCYCAAPRRPAPLSTFRTRLSNSHSTISTASPSTTTRADDGDDMADSSFADVFHDAANLSVSRFLRLVSGSRPNTRSNEVEEFDSNTRCSQTPTKITILLSDFFL
jgi:hypothetical protein